MRSSCYALLAVAACIQAVQAGRLYASAPQHRGQYYRTGSGSYNYGYNTGEGIAKVEVKREDGSVVGSYRYFDPNGKQIVRSYIADSNGFRILGNDLPINPETPAAAVLGAPALTASVEGAHQQVVNAAQHPSKPRHTVDISRIAAPRTAAPTYREYGEEETAASNNYYYFPYQYNYDFPAGFAYPTAFSAPPPSPVIIGTRRNFDVVDNSITVGKGVTRSSAGEPYGIVSRRFRPVVVRPPYIIGRRA